MDIDTVLRGKYPAKQHAQRVVEQLRTKLPGATGVLYLEGRREKKLEDSDMDEPFRQRRYFYYLTGCPLADSYAIHDMSTSTTTLFIPRADPRRVVWDGLPMTPAEALETFDVDQVRYADEVEDALADLQSAGPNTTVFAIRDQVSKATSDRLKVDELKDAIDMCRVVKDEYEVALISKANIISSKAHRRVLEHVRSACNEQDLEAVFLSTCVAAGAKKQPYQAIVASGHAAATLHYVHNDKPLAGKQLLLVDAACEWDCYASDITRTLPINGRFTTEARAIYDIVLQMQLDCLAMLKGGVAWEDVHIQAHMTATDGLRRLGLLRGDVADLAQSKITAAFMPHGLGHHLGLDVHDVGGKPRHDDANPIFRYLRIRGSVPAGSVVTVEPGIYFCRHVIEPLLRDPRSASFIDEAVLDRYWDVGGVRIEDNVLVTETGHVNLTPAVKDADEMEKIIAQG